MGNLLKKSIEKMSLNGSRKKTGSENGAGFGAAIKATPEQLEKAAKTVTTLKYEISENTVKTTRTYNYPDGSSDTVSNSGTIGGEAEYQFLTHKIPCAISGSDGDLTLKSKSGWATANAKIVGGKSIESITHHESGQTMTNTWERA